MTAEMTDDYNERTSVSTYRMVFNIVGYLFGAGITSVLTAIISDNFGMSVKEAWSVIGLIYGAIAAITIISDRTFENGLNMRPSAALLINEFTSSFMPNLS